MSPFVQQCYCCFCLYLQEKEERAFWAKICIKSLLSKFQNPIKNLRKGKIKVITSKKRDYQIFFLLQITFINQQHENTNSKGG